MTTPQAYIVDAIRTPVGKRNGSLASSPARNRPALLCLAPGPRIDGRRRLDVGEGR